MTHICVNKLTIIGSDDGLSPGRRHAIIWTNVGILLIGPLGTNFSEITIKTHIFSFKKMHFKMSSGEWRPFCLGLNVLNWRWSQGMANYILHKTTSVISIQLPNVSKRGPGPASRAPKGDRHNTTYRFVARWVLWQTNTNNWNLPYFRAMHSFFNWPSWNYRTQKCGNGMHEYRNIA